MKYFVYANKTNVKNPELKERALYFVPEKDLRVWASKFEPNIMEFCGVSVEAEDMEAAKAAFLTPLDNDGFDKMVAEQEPLVTRFRTRAANKNKERLAEATMTLMVNRLATLWGHIDEMFLAMAQLYVLHHDDLTEEQAYRKIKQEWLNKYKDM